MKIIQTVTVKQVLTEQSREKLSVKYHQSKQQLQKECEQLRFEMKKMERMRKFSPSAISDQFGKEIDMRKEKIKLIDFQIEQLKMLPYGSEIKVQDVEAIIDVQVGDNWEHVMKGRTIIVKDGMIAEIRED